MTPSRQALAARPRAATRWLAAAYVWALLCAVVACTVPVTSDGVTQISPSGQEIPPQRQSLFQHSHGLVLEVGLLAVLVLLCASVELGWRRHRRRAGPGLVTIVVAGCVLLFSFFGFIFGVLSLGLLSLLALLSSLPGCSTPALPTDGAPTAHRS